MLIDPNIDGYPYSAIDTYAKRVGRVGAAATMLAAMAGGTAYSIDRIVEYNHDHPPTSSVDSVKKDLGVETNSAPVIAPEAPKPGEVPESVVSGMPEATHVLPPTGAEV